MSIIDAVALASTAPDSAKREPAKGWDAADAIAEWEDLAALRKAAHGLQAYLDLVFGPPAPKDKQPKRTRRPGSGYNSP